jgi:isopentenyl-diphosphate delta-isomerase
MKGKSEVLLILNKIIDELKTAMFLTGASTIEELRKKDLVLTGMTKDWLENRGINCKKYARR